MFFYWIFQFALETWTQSDLYNVINIFRQYTDFPHPPTSGMDPRRPKTEPSCATLSEIFPAAPVIGPGWREEIEMEI